MSVIRCLAHPVNILRRQNLSAHAKLIWLYLHMVPEKITIEDLCKHLNLTEFELKTYIKELHENALCEGVEIV